MFYYQWNIGDYSSHTSRLSIFEDLSYRRLLDLYYLNEEPISGSPSEISRDIGMAEYLDAVKYVLNKFFENDNGLWVNTRANREIAVYQRKVKSAKAAGKASGKARRLKAYERTLNKPSTNVEPTNNQEPITKNHKPTTIIKDPCATAQFDDFWKEYPIKRDKKKAKAAWLRKKLNGKSEDIINDVINRIINDPQWIKGYIPLPTTYINGERWDDEFTKQKGKRDINDISQQNYKSGAF